MPTPDSFQQALALHQQGHFKKAENAYRCLLQQTPEHFNLLQLLGTVCAQQQRYTEAVDYLRKALALDSSLAATHHNLGNALKSLGLHEEAVAAYAQALILQPDHFDALLARGNSCKTLGRHEAAIADYDAALKLQPGNASVLINRSNALRALDRQEEALAGYDQALLLQPVSVEANYNRGNALMALKRHEEALLAFDRTLELKPGDTKRLALTNKGNAFSALGRFEAALACYDAAIADSPDYANAWFNRGNAQLKLHHQQEGRENFEQALRIDPDFADAWNGLGKALTGLKHKSKAVEALEKALELRPDYVEALYNLGDALMQSRRYTEAATIYERILALDPDGKYVMGVAYDCRHHACDWNSHEATRQALVDGVQANQKVCPPFVFISVSDDPLLQLQCARIFTRDHEGETPEPLWRGERYAHQRIRVAYLSADFHAHAVSFKVVELFELQDQSAFECFAYSFGVEKGGELRSRLEAAFEHFIDVSELSDRELAQRLRDDEIDIAVDLMGWTQNYRPGVFVLRPAPVTLGYIGYPGSIGAPWMDYILADAVVIPKGEEAYYDEQVIRMPHSYQVNDRQYEIAAFTPSRVELGLPEAAFVFCCFNNNYKVNPVIFSLWLRLLAAVENSVLWLLGDNDVITANLQAVARQQGVASERLIFSGRCALPDHLARLNRADLFLDTLPYNGHATASDTLWAGLPLLTCTGRSFASRVAASLLQALELPELIAASLEDYEARALHLARNPKVLKAIRQKLMDKRQSAPLFDTPRFTRHLERAFKHMHERSAAGLPPEGFDVITMREDELQTANTAAARVNRKSVQPSAFTQGTALLKLGQIEKALELLQQAVLDDPMHAPSHSNLAAALLHLENFEGAANSAREASRLAPGFADGWNNLGSALMKQNKASEALAAYDKAVALAPGNASMHSNRGMALDKLNRPGEAALVYARARKLDPNYRGIDSSQVFALRKSCLWAGQEAEAILIANTEQQLIQKVRDNQQIAPFVIMALASDPALLLQAARNFTHLRYPPANEPLWTGQRYAHQRIRVAYLSADFHNHATADLMAELFELHDRTRFECWAISYGAEKSGPMRQRLERGFEHFLDVSELSDLTVARKLLELEIDIAVDLKGYTQECRPGILGHRPAPVQVSYLGFPGSMGSPVIDYIVADAVVIPPGEDCYYSEQVVRLPHCYQVNDRKRAIAGDPQNRSNHGLPEQAFVFCCFNNNYKLTPNLFDIWMRLLLAVPDSVLWLLESNGESAGNLRQEAQRRGVESSRLVFAAKMPLDKHLARHRCADLFLDTLPYNAHTTCSDALWAGLPVLTCLGNAFPGRVAASLLRAIEVPELITNSLEEYEGLALALATDPSRLKELRLKLESNRLCTPLFDTPRFAIHLEQAYLAMHECSSQGLLPQAFTVPVDD